MTSLIVHGDARRIPLPDRCVQCCVTSPPYWGLRDYGVDGQLGMEPTPDEYVRNMVSVFSEVKRVLRDDGTLWLNLGDSYISQGGHGGQGKTSQRQGRSNVDAMNHDGGRPPVAGLKTKDLCGIPWRVAFALQNAGWYLRSDIIWHKPNPMPESVTDRPTKSHEYLFLLAKSERYHYDADAIRENVNAAPDVRLRSSTFSKQGKVGNHHQGAAVLSIVGRNRRSVWTIPSSPFPGAHFAVMPAALVEPCVRAGAPVGGLVLDPFAGSGTVGAVATGLGRRFVGVEINPAFARMATRRIARPHARVERVGRDESMPLFAS